MIPFTSKSVPFWYVFTYEDDHSIPFFTLKVGFIYISEIMKKDIYEGEDSFRLGTVFHR